MPPEITAVPSSTAGLMALAGAPPGVAASAGPSPPEPLGASLFAAFLAQSSPPSVLPAAPKAAATQTLVMDPKQTPLDRQALPIAKTMDTLPMLSFPVLPKAKVKASELPFPAAVAHQKAAQDQKSADGIPAPNAPGPAPTLAGQSAAPPVLFATPALTTPAAAMTVPVAAAPGPASSAAPPVQAAPEQAGLVSPSRSDTSPGLTLPSVAIPNQTTLSQPAPAWTAPAQTGLPLPRAGARSAPLQAVPQSIPPPAVMPAAVTTAAARPTTATPAGQVLPEPKAVSLLTVQPASVEPASVEPASVEPASVEPASVEPASATTTAAARALPRVPSPVTSIPQAPAAPLPAALREVIPSPVPLATSQNAPTLTGTAAAAVPLAAALPAPETPKLSPAKTTGKFLPAALKPAGKNADTSTRTTAEQVPSVGAKTSASPAAPEPMPEKHLEEQPSEPAGGGGTNSVPTLSQAVASAETAKAGTQPLSAQDRAEVVRQAADGVGAMPLPAKPGAPEQMSVQLHPKDWGSLQVSVTVAPSQNAGAAKTVTAHIVAETPQVKAALQSGTGALHQALRASGLHLEHLTVSVKAPEGKTVEAKPAAQSASAGMTSGQRQADQSAQGYGQPGAGSGGFGASHFGTGGSSDNCQGQPPPPLLPDAPDAEPDDTSAAGTPLRPAAGRVDTRA